jgi:hypothetical protein
MPALTATALWFAGCDGVGKSPEERINEAVPVAEAVQSSRDALDGLLTEADAEEISRIDAEMASRLKIRALSCSKGYEPGFFESGESLRSVIANAECFAAYDKTLAAWLNHRRIGLLLAAGPLRPIPREVPRFVTATMSIGNVWFADSAGVALFASAGTLEILDLKDSSPIFSETSDPTRSWQSSSRLSPNGRLFLTSRQGALSLRDTETGAVLADFDDLSGFHWLEGQTALVTDREHPREPRLLDFATGERIPIRGVSDSIQKVVPAPAEGEFVIGSHRGLVRIALDRSDGKVAAQVVDDEDLEGGGSWSDNTGTYDSDYERYVGGGGAITVVTLDPLSVQRITLEAFRPQIAMPTPDPDLVLVTGAFVRSHAGGARTFVVNTSDLTIAPLEGAPHGARYVYIPSLDRVGVITGSRIELLEELPLGEFRSFEEFGGQALTEANLRQLEAFQRGSGLTSEIPEGLPVPTWARDAEIIAVGVYESTAGEHGPGKDRRAGPVTVHVKRGGKPIVLVLASYEPVQWRVEPEFGARISAVLLGGYYQSRVQGIGDAKQIDIGRVYAYQQGGEGYRELEVAVARYTGKRIHSFQGRYSGQTFTVDSR